MRSADLLVAPSALLTPTLTKAPPFAFSVTQINIPVCIFTCCNYHVVKASIVCEVCLTTGSKCLLSFIPPDAAAGFVPLFSEAGSGTCKPRPACTVSDYFYTHTPCDSKGKVSGVHRKQIISHRLVQLLSKYESLGWPRGRLRLCALLRVCCQTQLMYKWVQPKICSETVKGAVKLPASGRKQSCPPCNPGFFFTNSSTCEPCDQGSYSNGTGVEFTNSSRNLTCR